MHHLFPGGFTPSSPTIRRQPGGGRSRHRPASEPRRRRGSGDGGDRRRLCDLAMLAAAAAFSVPVAELTAESRRASDVAFARQSAMYLAHVAFGLSYSDIGRAFGRDRTTAAHACRLVEDRRDDPVIDAALDILEAACASARGSLPAQAMGLIQATRQVRS